MTFIPIVDERSILLGQQIQREETARFLQTLSEDPEGTARLVDLISQWGDHAPTLPPGAIYGLASAGVGPQGPIGQKIIQGGVPALSQKSDALDRAIAAIDTTNLASAPQASIGPQQGTYGPDVAVDSGGGGGIANTIESGLSSAAGAVGRGIVSATRTAMGQQPIAAVSTPGFNGPSADTQIGRQSAGLTTGEALKTAARETFAVANTGLQALEVPPKLAAAITATVRGHPEGGEVPLPFGGHMGVGSIGDTLNPKQFTLYQQLHGKDIGSGILPGGPATEAANEAQRQAADVNGHALTYGRALASVVAEPGTRPYSILSGLTDAGVALGLDPMANALRLGSEASAAAREFAPITDNVASNIAHYLVDNAHSSEQVDGLNRLAGADDLIEGLAKRAQEEPGRVANVAQSLGIDTKGLHRAAAGSQSGIFVGLRPFFHKQTALEWLSSKQGGGVVDRLAGDHSFTSIRSLLGDAVPVDVVASLAHADSSDAVRNVLSTELGTSISGPASYKAFRPPENLRLFTQMPKGSIDLTNNQQMVEQAERTLAIAKVPKDRWDAILEPMATAKTLGDAKNAYVNRLGDALIDKLTEDGVPPDLAKKLTRFFPNQWEQQRMFNVDAVGQPARSAGLSVDGEPAIILGPHLDNELARMVPPLDYRSLRQVTQKSRQLLHFWNDGYATDAEGFAGGVSRVAHSVSRVESYLSGELTGLFKTFVLAAPRVPVRFLADEQAAMASAGVDSMFRNPLSYIATVVGTKAGHDITGAEFADFLGDRQSEFASALGAAAHTNPSPWSAEQQLLKAFVHYGKDDGPNYTRGWADELSTLHTSLIGREVARALTDQTYQPAGITTDLRGLDAVKEWFSNGPGVKTLNDLRTAKLRWGSEMLNERAAADAYVDTVRDRIMVKTGGDQTLLDAVATGKPFDFRKANQGLGKSVSHEFRQYLKAHVDDIGPDVVKTRAQETRFSGAGGGIVSYVGDRMLGALMDFPARNLTRSPAFRQWYYQDIQRLFPKLTEEAQALALRNAAEDGMALKSVASHGLLELEDADRIAKARSLAKMHDYLYYPGEKTTAEDILRNVMPFAPAWHSVIKRWTKLAIEQPQVVRHAQQGVQSLQSSGFFHPSGDPTKPGDLFTIAGPEIMKSLTGADGFAMEGKVQGLNIVGNGLPGVGVGVQMLASAALPKTPTTAGLRSFINPYGDPDISGGFVESLFPGAFQKLRAGGYTKIGNFGWDPTKRQEVTVLDLAKRVFTTAVSSGRYDLTDLHVRQKLYDQSLAQAQRLYLWRGLAQFVVPSAPDYTPNAKLKDGRAIALWKLTEDYQKLLKADKGDGDKATLEFVDKYGPNLIFATQPLNLRTVYGAPTSTSGLLWKEQHSTFAKIYPQVYGYFIPHDDARGPYQNYLDAIKSGDILPLTVDKWAQLADQHLGNAIYSQVRSKLGPSLSKAERTGLARVRAQIQQQYPGFNIELGLPARATTQERINDLYGLPGKAGALEDPAVRDSPLARTAMDYLRARDQFLRAGGKNPVSGSFKAANMAGYRDVLFQIGTDLAQKHPEFAPMWNFLLQPEVTPSGY